ncbi:FGF signaling regulator protein canopy b [Arctopsyche grandis]|uniref:FGF signaling regulator protein canopy b n=1 Tax=Arctopsyche grandis TaxID=121162 RepID=UPI00406D6355
MELRSRLKIFSWILVTFCIAVASADSIAEEEHGVRYADSCEACKLLALELSGRLQETGRSHDVIETGYSLDDVAPRKRTSYHKSELRLIDSLDGICQRILDYNIHKERTDSTRFAKGQSQTFKTLHGLVDKGVNVNLGIPYELWDKPSVEITTLKAQCETLLEEFEEDIEDWYWHHQEKTDLKQYLCVDRVLKGKNTSCLREQLKGEIKEKSEL